MLTAGCVMMIAPSAELAVQLHNEERPQFLLLGGFFLVGLLAAFHALSHPHIPSSPHAPLETGPRTRHKSGDVLWVNDTRD